MLNPYPQKCPNCGGGLIIDGAPDGTYRCEKCDIWIDQYLEIIPFQKCPNCGNPWLLLIEAVKSNYYNCGMCFTQFDENWNEIKMD